MLAFWVFFICSFVLMHMGRLIYQKPCKLIREVDREVAEDRNWGVALVEVCRAGLALGMGVACAIGSGARFVQDYASLCKRCWGC